jgi:hypothetical protein
VNYEQEIVEKFKDKYIIAKKERTKRKDTTGSEQNVSSGKSTGQVCRVDVFGDGWS